MASTEPHRQTNSFHYFPLSKKRKISSSGTCLEDLPNEIFYEIFGYLNTNDIFTEFHDLNKRFHGLLHKSELSLKVNLSLMTEMNFQELNREFLIPNRHRIQTLNIQNPFLIDFIFSSNEIVNKFLRLQTLIFNDVDPKSFPNILRYLALLENLSTLIIISTQNLEKTFTSIFRLSKLKYCKVKYQASFQNQTISFNSKLTSSIEHIVIDADVTTDNFLSLPSCIPHLQTLFIGSLRTDLFHLSSIDINASRWNHLAKVQINNITIPFQEFELISKQLFSQLQVLRISIFHHDEEYLNARRWEELIINSMSKLRSFDFQYETQFGTEITSENVHTKYKRILNDFSSSFWAERTWLFDYNYSLSQKHSMFTVIFYSINFKRKEYVLDKNLIKFPAEKYIEHITIRNEEAMLKCNHYFPRTTHLVFSTMFDRSASYLSNMLTNIMPIKHLTNLTLTEWHFSMKQFVHLLNAMSNVQVLNFKFNWNVSEQNDIKEIQQSEIFRNVSKNNRISHLIINNTFEVETINFFITLCSQIKHLTFKLYQREYQQSLGFLLLKKQTILPKLCLLQLPCVSIIVRHNLEIFLKTIKSFDNYYYKWIENDYYIFYQ